MVHSTDLVLSWSKPHEFDFLQEVLDKDEYRSLCTMHVYIAKVNNHLFKIHSGMVADTVASAVPETIGYALKIFKGHSGPPTSVLLQWVETSVEEKFPFAKSDLDSVLNQIYKIRDAARKLDILYETQVRKAQSLPDDHGRLSKDFAVVLDALHQLELLVISNQANSTGGALTSKRTG